MNLNILNSKIKPIQNECDVFLTEKDFDPCTPFFIEHAFNPESFGKIKTKGILETIRYIRHFLKVIDTLLIEGGELYIEFYRVSFDVGGYPLRPLNYLMNEISLCYKDRYVLYHKEFRDNIDFLWLKKLKPSLPHFDSITRWSFGIVSDGKKNERILNIINQIQEFNIPEFEILICGPPPSDNLQAFVKVLDDSELYSDIRIPISKKKNKIIENACFNNLVIMHDRISFPKDWYKRICLNGNYFDQLCMPILDEETQSLRVNDWIKSYHDFTLFQLSNSVPLKYSEWDRHIYSDGGFLLIKKHIMETQKFNSFLNWGEMEDVDLSERLYLNGNSVSFYPNTFILTQTHRIKVYKQNINWLKIIFNPVINIRYNYLQKKKIKIAFSNFLERNN